MRKLFVLLLAALCCLTPLAALAQEAGADVAVPARKNAPLSLLSHLYQGQNTLVYSPLSLSAALNLAAEGADGETLVQLKAFLADSDPQWDIMEDLAFCGVKTANAAFVRPGFLLLEDYRDALMDKYETAPNAMNEGAVMEQVNGWVEEQTDGLIPQLLEREPDGMTSLLLVNALHMKADWLFPFDPSITDAGLFHAPAHDVEVSAMHLSEQLLYGEAGGVQSVALPYKDSPLQMLILMSEDGDLAPLVEEMAASPDAFIEKYMPGEYARVALSLPNLRAESAFELRDALEKAGVADAFDPARADFSRMAEGALDNRLHIGSVVQKAVLNVNEAGTEAAAATVVEMRAMGALAGPVVEMNVDRPYMMLVLDPETDYVLFVACVNNPA